MGGAAIIDDDLTLAYGWAGSLPGDSQTPPMACIYGAFGVLNRCAGSVVIIADCKKIVDKFNQGCGRLDLFGMHGDLWKQWLDHGKR